MTRFRSGTPASRRAHSARRLAILAFALAGCGGQGARPPVPATSVIEGIQGRDCRYVADLDAIPSFRDLARPGAGGNISLWGRDLAASDTVELSVRWAEDGRLQWVRAIRSSVGGQRVAALEQLVLEAMNEMARADWGVRLLVVGGDVAGVAPSVVCQPEREGFIGTLDNIPLSYEVYRDLYQLGGQPIPVRVRLDARGGILGVELVRQTFSHWVNQFVLDFVRNTRFEPKLHDGIGVATIFEFNLRFPRR